MKKLLLSLTLIGTLGVSAFAAKQNKRIIFSGEEELCVPENQDQEAYNICLDILSNNNELTKTIEKSDVGGLLFYEKTIITLPQEISQEEDMIIIKEMIEKLVEQKQNQENKALLSLLQNSTANKFDTIKKIANQLKITAFQEAFATLINMPKSIVFSGANQELVITKQEREKYNTFKANTNITTKMNEPNFPNKKEFTITLPENIATQEALNILNEIIEKIEEHNKNLEGQVIEAFLQNCDDDKLIVVSNIANFFNMQIIKTKFTNEQQNLINEHNQRNMIQALPLDVRTKMFQFAL